jgi:hypothetical protein
MNEWKLPVVASLRGVMRVEEIGECVEIACRGFASRRAECGGDESIGGSYMSRFRRRAC